jgi:hypothetical protein
MSPTSRSDVWFAWRPVRSGALGAGPWLWWRHVWRNRCRGVTIYQPLDLVREPSPFETALMTPDRKLSGDEIDAILRQFFHSRNDSHPIDMGYKDDPTLDRDKLIAVDVASGYGRLRRWAFKTKNTTHHIALTSEGVLRCWTDNGRRMESFSAPTASALALLFAVSLGFEAEIPDELVRKAPDWRVGEVVPDPEGEAECERMEQEWKGGPDGQARAG